jgi:hypothetical protein
MKNRERLLAAQRIRDQKKKLLIVDRPPSDVLVELKV